MMNDLHTTDTTVRHLKLLHYALRLPTALYHGKRLVYALPKEMPDIRLQIEHEQVLMTLRQRLQVGRAMFVYQIPKKGYIGLRQNADQLLLLGPIIKISQVSMADDAEMGKLVKQQVIHLNEDEIFYIAALLEEFFFSAFSFHEITAKESERKVTAAPVQPELHNSMSSFFSHPPFFLEQELAMAIKQGRQASALEALHEINRLQRAQVAVNPIRSLKNSLIGSCALCSRAAISGGLSADNAFSLADGFIRRIEENNSLKRLNELEEMMVLGFCQCVDKLHQGYVSKLVLEAMHYIDESLTEKIRLADIAAQVYIHPDYLGSLFKKETGETVTRYIQKRRVQEACRFLRYSNFSIADIAGYFQFSSQSAFTKVFRQFQTLTPKQYRNKSESQI